MEGTRHFLLFSSGYRLRERVLAWVADFPKSILHASDTPEMLFVGAALLYVLLTCFAGLGDLRQSGLTRFGKFRQVFFHAQADATLAGLNIGTLRFYVACTRPRVATLLRVATDAESSTAAPMIMRVFIITLFSL